MTNEEIKALAYDLIDDQFGCPFDYVDESREDLLVLGEVYGIIKMCNKICEKEDEK